MSNSEEQGHPGAAGGHPAGGPPPAGWGYGPGEVPQPPRRPGNVVAAVVMTYIGSALLILLGLLLLIGSANAEFRQGFAEGAGMATVAPGAVVVAGAVSALIGIGLVVLAAFAQRARDGARIALTVIGGVFLVLQLLSLVGGAPQALLGIVWIGVATTLFWLGNANAWYRHARP